MQALSVTTKPKHHHLSQVVGICFGHDFLNDLIVLSIPDEALFQDWHKFFSNLSLPRAYNSLSKSLGVELRRRWAETKDQISVNEKDRKRLDEPNSVLGPHFREFVKSLGVKISKKDADNLRQLVLERADLRDSDETVLLMHIHDAIFAPKLTVLQRLP